MNSTGTVRYFTYFINLDPGPEPGGYCHADLQGSGSDPHVSRSRSSFHDLDADPDSKNRYASLGKVRYRFFLRESEVGNFNASLISFLKVKI